MAEREPGISLSCALFIECRFHVKREQARCIWSRWLVLLLHALTRPGHTAGADAAVVRLTCLLSSRVGREAETGSRNLLFFGLQSRGCTTAVSVLEACSGPVPWQPSASASTRRRNGEGVRELRVCRLHRSTRPPRNEDSNREETVDTYTCSSGYPKESNDMVLP